MNTIQESKRVQVKNYLPGKSKYNMTVHVPGPEVAALPVTPLNMMAVVAKALDMSMDTYRTQSRERDIVELRFLASLFMRIHFPFVTLRQIAALFDKKDHSSIINGIARANDLLYIRDTAFVNKYERASTAVDQWIARHNSIAA